MPPVGLRRRRISIRTRAPPATPPAAIAAAGRSQLRGSRRAASSDSESSSAQAESSSAAASVTALRVSSTRPESFSGGSIGRSAERSSCSTSPRPSAGSVIGIQFFLKLLDRPVDEDLGGAIAAAQRPGDLAVVHAERESHDQYLAPVVRELLHALDHVLELLPALDDALGPVQGRDRVALVEHALRSPRAIAVVV